MSEINDMYTGEEILSYQYVDLPKQEDENTSTKWENGSPASTSTRTLRKR